MRLEDLFNDESIRENLERGESPRRHVSEEEHRRYVQDALFETFENWHRKRSSVEEMYSSAVSTLEELTVPYDFDDVHGLCHSPNLGDWNSDNLEIFVAALINNIIKEDDTFVIKPREWVLDEYIGLFLPRGTLIIEGNVSNYVGYGNKGGRIRVKGNAQTNYGDNMTSGELIIEGNVCADGFNYVKGGHGVLKGIIDTSRGHYGSIAAKQEGGLIEIHCDIPAECDTGTEYDGSDKGIGCGQKAGDLKIYGDVYCHVNNYQKGGNTYIKGNCVGSMAGIGEGKEGGETIIDGNSLATVRDGQRYGIGHRQKGGTIRVTGNVEASVAIDAYSGAKIIINGDVVGNIGGYQCAGADIYIGGNVKGDVGFQSIDMICIIEGNVYGNVGELFGYDYDMSKRKRDGKIVIKKNVNGSVGNSMRARSYVWVEGDIKGTAGDDMDGGTIYVHGRIANLGETWSGKVYQKSGMSGSTIKYRDVTYIPLIFKALNLFFGNRE